MKKLNWIWLDPELYPERQTARYTGVWAAECDDGTVVEFSREYILDKDIESLRVTYSSDATSQLYVNDSFIGTGPVNIGGDFSFNDRPRENRYYSTLTLSGEVDKPEKNRLSFKKDGGRVKFLARVRLSPVQICEFSMGHGGFALSAEITTEDGRVHEINTDESWCATLCPQYESASGFDGRRASLCERSAAHSTPDVWNATPSPLPHRIEQKRAPMCENSFNVPGKSKQTVDIEYDKIYAAFTRVGVVCNGEIEITLSITEGEDDATKKTESLIFTESGEYIGVRMYGVGMIRAEIENRSNTAATVSIGINEAYLPPAPESLTKTSDTELNDVLSLCAHSLKYARQYIHLDSPKHCEPLACTGDYFIESEMETFSTSDTALAEFDVIRTARVIEHGNGEMFHPTYSLIWVRMLRNVYKKCGNISLLRECEKALGILLDKFHTYRNKDGLIDTPPSFMFVDWIVADGYSLHHPPKALGQSVINMFYYDALCCACDIYGALSDDPTSDAQKRDERKKNAVLCQREKETLRDEINTHLYDKQEEMYHEGLNTPTPDSDLSHYLPQNTDKRYYRINSNALAVAFGVIEGEAATKLLDRLLSSGDFDDYQPYFAHFVLMAVHRAGLDEKHLLRILDKWREPMRKCSKGLAEGFIPPEEGYAFDHSHAWGGTPLYSLPMGLTSLEILKPGMSHVSISPKLLGLEYAKVIIPTPMGDITVEMKEDHPPKVTSPIGVRVDVV